MAVDVGSQNAQQYFGKGYILETNAPAATTTPTTPTGNTTTPNLPSPTATPTATQVTSAVTDKAGAPTATQTPNPPTTAVATTDQSAAATQIRNIDELNSLTKLGLTEGDITRQGSAIFLKPGITAESLQARSTKPATATNPSAVTDVATVTPTSQAELLTDTGKSGFDAFKDIAPDRAKILEETFQQLGLTGAEKLYGQVGEKANEVGNALEALPKTIQERTQNVGVTQNQLNRLVATEAEPIAQALKDLLTSRSLLGDQLAFGMQQAEFNAQGQEANFDRYNDLLSSSGLALNPQTGKVGESYQAEQNRLTQERNLAADEQARLDNFNQAQGYVQNPETGQLAPTFARTQWMAENGIGQYDANTAIQATGQTGNFGLELMQTSGGVPADRNNNPLNIKASNYTAGFGGVLGQDQAGALDSGNFLVFDSPEAGFAAATELWRNGSKYQNVDVGTALERWSGGGYGGELASSVGLDPNQDAQSLSNEQLHTLQQAMAKREGFSGADVPDLNSTESVLNKQQFTDVYIDEVGKQLSMSPDINNPEFKGEIDRLYDEYVASLGPEAVKNAVPLTTTDKQKMYNLGLDPADLEDINTYLNNKFSSTQNSSQETSSNPFK